MGIMSSICIPCGGIKTTKAADFQRLSRTPAGGRTLDTLIKSQVLYQLSYGSIVLWVQKYNLFSFPQCFFNKKFTYLR